jgi:parallel beta-helix repeat protein
VINSNGNGSDELALATSNPDQETIHTSVNSIMAYEPHDPIHILNDSAFGPTGYNFPGTGTINDPYVIEGYNITSSTGPLIQIENTTKYFQLNNNILNFTLEGTFYKGNKYKFIQSVTSWVSAKAACEALGGHLVTISDIGENHFVADLAKEESNFWIGLTDNEAYGGQEDTGHTGMAPYWVWITGEPLTFTNWLSPNPQDYTPGQDWGLMYGGANGVYGDYQDATGGWNDFGDSDTSNYICEWEADSIYDSIYLNNVSNGEIKNNSILNANMGIQLDNTINVSIVNNEISNHTSYAIFADQSEFNNISNNRISDCDIGIYGNSSHFNNISTNLISDCMEGVSFIFSNSNLVERNTFYDCLKASISLQSSTENAIKWNNFFLGHKSVIFNGHKYLVVNEIKDWTIAKTESEVLGGHLITISDQAERDFVYEILVENDGAKTWIGLTDDDIYGGQEDTDNDGTAPYWVWVSGEAFIYDDWGSGLPNNGGATNIHYVYMDPGISGGTWNDYYNTANVWYIVEWDSIDYVQDTGLGNNTYQYNYWDGFESPDENSDGIADIPYRFSNHGLSFDGNDDYAELTNFVLAKNFTIEFWVNIIDVNSFQCIICKETSTGGWIFLLFVTGGNLKIYDRDSSVFLDPITPGWQHLAIVIEEGSSTFDYKIYRNGSIFGTGTMVDVIGYNPSDKPWTLGMEWDAGPVTSDHFKGAYDEIRFLNRSLTSAEIYEDYTSSNNNYPPRTETVAWYHLNETSGTSIHDSSGNENHGTTYNGAGWKQALDPFPRIAPIWIDDDGDFPNFSSSGDGTSASPYIIENYYFISNRTNLIEIQNTTAHFMIINSFLDGLGGSYDNFYIKNVTNGWIRNNEITNGYYGINVESSENILIERNFICNEMDGIYLTSSCDNVNIRRNLIYNNTGYGIEIDSSSDNNTIEWNIILNNNQTGHQAYDGGLNNIFQYNRWNDWISPDVNIDGFVDDPYDIDGGNNQDLYPVTTEIPLVEIISPVAQFYGIDTLSVIISGNAFLFTYYIEGADSSNQTWISSSSRTLDEGEYVLHVYGSDPLDKYTVYKSVSFTIDTLPPSIVISSPLSTTHRQKDIILAYTISDQTVIDTTIYVNDVANTTAIPSGSSSAFPDGDYNITFIIEDQAGNIAISTVIFTVDTIPPTVTIISPTTGSYPTGSITVTLSGDAEAYWYYITGVDGSNHTWSLSVSRTLADGTYTLHAYGNDSAGNIAHASVTFTIGTATTTTSQDTSTETTDTTTTTESKSGSFAGIITLIFCMTSLAVVIRKRKNK